MTLLPGFLETCEMLPGKVQRHSLKKLLLYFGSFLLVGKSAGY